MHPILASVRRLLLYLLIWLPITALMVYVVWASGRIGWKEAAAAVAPASLLLSFVCLSAWFVCRARPRPLEDALNSAAAHSVAALAGGLVFAGAAWLSAAGFSQSGALPETARSIGQHLPLLAGLGPFSISSPPA